MEKEKILDKEVLRQSKFDYYRKLNLWIILISTIVEITYFFSDCLLFGHFANETLFARCSVIIPLFFFIIINKKCKHYKTITIASYITLHSIMWAMLLAIYFLPTKIYASESFIIIHLMFLAIGLSTPPTYAISFHSLVIVNILVSNTFNHYQNLLNILLLNTMFLMTVELLLWVLDRTYKENYVIKKELENSLYIDQLTQAYNRNIFKKIVKKETSELPFENCYVLILDIDFFKKVNDTYGHDKGDIVLFSIANTISKCISKEDYLIRWGGEEFVIIAPNHDLKSIAILAENINREVREVDNGVCKTTISIGIAKYHPHEDFNHTIAEADKALYNAKKNGRNQYKIFKKDDTNTLSYF